VHRVNSRGTPSCSAIHLDEVDKLAVRVREELSMTRRTVVVARRSGLKWPKLLPPRELRNARDALRGIRLQFGLVFVLAFSSSSTTTTTTATATPVVLAMAALVVMVVVVMAMAVFVLGLVGLLLLLGVELHVPGLPVHLAGLLQHFVLVEPARHGHHHHLLLPPLCPHVEHAAHLADLLQDYLLALRAAHLHLQLTFLRTRLPPLDFVR
jgi:hypothetical protein